VGTVAGPESDCASAAARAANVSEMSLYILGPTLNIGEAGPNAGLQGGLLAHAEMQKVEKQASAYVM
jgi:hypothetical protein